MYHVEGFEVHDSHLGGCAGDEGYGVKSHSLYRAVVLRYRVSGIRKQSLGANQVESRYSAPPSGTGLGIAT